MIPVVITIFFSCLYISMQILSIYAGDSGELVAAAYTWGVAHPPGYPLYMLLGGTVMHSFSSYTAAWRMGFLSSLPMAVSVFFVWNIVHVLTKSKMSATLSSCVYGLLYPVWLYAIVPEVFGLFALFSSVILYEFLLFQKTKKQQHLYIMAFLSGLSLTHHHLILLLLTSIVIHFWFRRKTYKQVISVSIWKLAVLFLLGFAFYLYAPIVSSRYPPFDWEHPASLMGFIRMVTRASYGTFKASYGTGVNYVDRLLNMMSLVQYACQDFTVVGIGLLLAGVITLWKKMKHVCIFFVIYAGLLVFYFFYAGFTLTNDFILGTLERFFIVPYQVIAIVIGIGLWGTAEGLRLYWKNHRTYTRVPFHIVYIVFVSACFLIPVRLFRFSYPKLNLLKQDRTLEKLADDVFASAPIGSILNLSDDTTTFAVDYAYYVQKKRQDIRIVKFPYFQFPYFPKSLKKQYSDIVIPSTPAPMSHIEYLKLFIESNYPYRTILTERIYASIPDYWIPRGLLVMYYAKKDEIPLDSVIIEKNNALWKGFQNPYDGVLGTYRHLMLSDVLRSYSDKRISYASALVSYGRFDEAQAEIRKSIRLTPDRLEMYIGYISTLVEKKVCANAKEVMELVTTLYMNEKDYFRIYHTMYANCPELRQALQEKEQEYQKSLKKFGAKIE